MKSFVVVFAIFVMAVFAADPDPEIPYDWFCSLEGAGYFYYTYGENKITWGEMGIKRVNGTAIFSADFCSGRRRDDRALVYLIRPDAPDSYLYANDVSSDVPNYKGSTGFVPVLSDYKYQGVETCGMDGNLQCHWFGYQDEATKLMARISFNKDDMKLVGEYFSFAENNWSLEIFYRYTLRYKHFQIDDAFSCAAFEGSPASTDAPWALTSACFNMPDSPFEGLCSMQGRGTCRYEYNPEEWHDDIRGEFDMKRVNDTAVFNIQFQDRAVGVYLIRPDVPDAYWYFNDNQGGIKGFQESTGLVSVFSQYTLTDWKECGIDHSMTCIWFRYTVPGTHMSSYIAFNQDNFSLVSEMFYIPDGGEFLILEFFYNEVKDFQHDELDEVFSCDKFGDGSPAATIAPWTLSYVCTSPSSEPSSTPGSDPSSTPGSEPSSTPGSDPSSAPGSDPSSTPGSEPSSTPGSDPSSTPGSEPSSTPGSDPSSTPGSQPSSTVTSSQDPKSSGSTGPFEPSSTSLHLPSLVAVALFAVAFILV